MVSVSTSAMKMLAKDTAIFIPIAISCVWSFPLKWKEFSFKISLSIQGNELESEVLNAMAIPSSCEHHSI